MSSAVRSPLPRWVQGPLDRVHIDWDPAPRQPRALAVVLATVVALAGSLVADLVLVKICEAAFPATKTFVHFAFGDYAKLTVIGVLIACAAWPVTTRITSVPRWVFFRMAIVVTVVLWVPDLWILAHGEPGDAVAFLMLMHLAIAVVTYNALVRLAPPRRRSGQRTGRSAPGIRDTTTPARRARPT